MNDCCTCLDKLLLELPTRARDRMVPLVNNECDVLVVGAGFIGVDVPVLDAAPESGRQMWAHVAPEHVHVVPAEKSA